MSLHVRGGQSGIQTTTLRTKVDEATNEQPHPTRRASPVDTRGSWWVKILHRVLRRVMAAVEVRRVRLGRQVARL